MNCCEKCFKDAELKAIIVGKNTKGSCDFCHSKNVYITELESNDEIRDCFEKLIDVYSPDSERPNNYPIENMDLLKNILFSKWNIFNIQPNDIYKFLVSLLAERYTNEPEIFDKPVGIFESVNEDYLKQYSILGIYQWEDFVKEIKEKNRFHTNIINKKNLDMVLHSLIKTYKKGQVFYRARICQNEEGYSIEDMKAPPPNVASSGRANPEGISCLYLADTVDTTLHEIRAGVHDYVTVGDFILKQDIQIINLVDIDKISPFMNSDINLIAANMIHLNKIKKSIAKPLRRYDSNLDYLPTQYICDLIKSENFAGIEYESTMKDGGINYAIFDQSLFECTQTKVYPIKSLRYYYK